MIGDAASPTTRAWPWVYTAPGLFLFVLPIAHTTPLRIACLVVATFATIATRSSRRPSARLPTALAAAFGFWFVVCLAASFHSIEPAYSWGEFRNEVLSTTAAFAVFWWLSDGAAAWRRWRTVLTASFVTVATIAVVSYARDGDWLRTALVGDRNAFSTYVVLMVPFLAVRWMASAGDPRRRLGYAAALLLAVVAGACTQNRNMWFGVALEALVLAALAWRRMAPDVRRRMRRRYIASAVVGVVCFAGTLAIVIHQKAVVSQTSTEEQARFDRDPRFEIWRYATGRIGEAPVFGHGYGRGILRNDFRTHFDNPLKWHAHNVVLDYLIEAGAFGGVAIVALFAALARHAWRIAGSRRGGDDRLDDESGDELARPWLLGAWALATIAGIALKIMTDDILVRDSALLFWSMLGIAFGLAGRIERDRSR